MADDNIITFPKAKKPIPKTEMPTAQEIQANISSMKEGEIIEITEALGSILMETITASGFIIDSRAENLPMICMFVECLKAVISQQYNITHPFHEIANKCFTTNENGDMVFNAPIFRFSDTPLEIPAEVAEALQESAPEGGV
jgi:hypothetical protein